jgi:hypothetical protein
MTLTAVNVVHGMPVVPASFPHRTRIGSRCIDFPRRCSPHIINSCRQWCSPLTIRISVSCSPLDLENLQAFDTSTFLDLSIPISSLDFFLTSQRWLSGHCMTSKSGSTASSKPSASSSSPQRWQSTRSNSSPSEAHRSKWQSKPDGSKVWPTVVLTLLLSLSDQDSLKSC